MKPLIVISDAAAGGDDCAAVAMLAANAQSRMQALIAISGNVWAETAAHNLEQLLQKLGLGNTVVPLFPSSFHRSRAEYFDRHERHLLPHAYVGALGDAIPDEPDGQFDLFELIMKFDKPDIAILGPLSILAQALRVHPRLGEHLGNVFFTGGALRVPGNATDNAEFNFWFDPDAADLVLASDLPVTLLPLDVMQGVRYPADLPAPGNSRLAAYLADYIRSGKNDALGDALLAALLLDPGLVSERTRLKLAAETDDPERLGAVTVLDAAAPRAAVDVITAFNEKALDGLLRRTLCV